MFMKFCCGWTTVSTGKVNICLDTCQQLEGHTDITVVYELTGEGAQQVAEEYT